MNEKIKGANTIKSFLEIVTSLINVPSLFPHICLISCLYFLLLFNNESINTHRKSNKLPTYPSGDIQLGFQLGNLYRTGDEY